ncbi:MAG: acetyl-CoA C-acetyltransferase [Acidobacteria bacterium]|nr:acetyl-CoA C-acetyltransferase [Acidobacteriota bacterium]
MTEALIVSATRTPIGKFLGSLKSMPAPVLGGIALKEAIRRAAIDPAVIDEVILGNVVSAGVGQNPARQAVIKGGLPTGISSYSLNKVCGSGLKAVALAAQSIRAGDNQVVVAGGMESMSNCPYMMFKVREGLRLGHGEIVDSMVHDGLWCAFENVHMGNSGEVVAEKYGVARKRQDEYALKSHQKAVAAIDAGKFKKEIVAVEMPQKKGPPVVFDTDESPRRESTLEALAKLAPAFKKDGTVTAGNAPGVNDGASALVVMSEGAVKNHGVRPVARIVGYATSGIEPKLVMMAPVGAVQKLVKKIGWNLQDVELMELNEAFSVQAIAVVDQLGYDFDRVNVNGGAVALGHPIGASGARILTTLLYAMEERGARRGIAALCLGGGDAVALAVERV